MEDMAQRVAALERRVNELEAERPTLVKQAFALTVAALQMDNMTTFFDELRAYHLGLAHEMSVVQDKQAATDIRLVEVQRLSARYTPTASLLATYEQIVAPTGRSLRSWLIEMQVPDRYRSVIAFRARRDNGQTPVRPAGLRPVAAGAGRRRGRRLDGRRHAHGRGAVLFEPAGLSEG